MLEEGKESTSINSEAINEIKSVSENGNKLIDINETLFCKKSSLIKTERLPLRV